MALHVNRFSDAELVDIYREVLGSLEKYKNDLSHILRYWDNEYIVPKEIEKITKSLVKGKYVIDKWQCLFDAHTNEVLAEVAYREWNSYILDLPNNQTIPLYAEKNRAGLHLFEWNEQMYNELPESWNTYRHTITQAHDIECFSFLDFDHHKEWWVMLHKILNAFHDQPEMFKGDVVYDAKHSWNESDEVDYAREIIEEMNLSTGKKDFLLELYSVADDKTSFFKFYERMRYLKDAVNVFEHKKLWHNYNNPDALVYNVLANQIPRFDDQLTTLQGITIDHALDLVSVQNFLQTYKESFDCMFAHLDAVWYISQKAPLDEKFQEARRVWGELREKIE